MDLMAKEDHIWAVQAAIAQDLDAVVAWLVKAALSGDRQIELGNHASRLLKLVESRSCELNVNVEELEQFFAPQPFLRAVTTENCKSGDLEKLVLLGLLTQDEVVSFEKSVLQGNGD